MKPINVLITIFNKTSSEITKIIEDNPIITYAVFQLERCPETKRDHIQMYILLFNTYINFS